MIFLSSFCELLFVGSLWRGLREQHCLWCKRDRCRMTVETIQPGRFIGQVSRDGQPVVYVSLLVAKKWLADGQWQTPEPIAI
jgi:hypothetical protein